MNIKDTYISVTTHEARVRKIGPVLSSILDQWPADRVILTVAQNLELPAFIKDSGICIVRSPDYGAFKKHSPLYIDLGIEQYIVADDDSIFPSNWFVNLLNWSHKLPGRVVCGRGKIWELGNTLHYPNGRVIHAERIIEPVPSHIYVGVGTALFRTDFFEADFFPFPEDNFKYSDDIWFSAKLKDNVKIYVVPYSKEEQHGTFGRPRQLGYGKEESCQWKTARANNYKEWDAALHEYRNKLLGNE
ncbi:MAG: hypothetical protein ACYTDW_13645 [Planctomycetota bacterium]|jgi:hypothetical protein